MIVDFKVKKVLGRDAQKGQTGLTGQRGAKAPKGEPVKSGIGGGKGQKGEPGRTYQEVS